MNTNDYGNLQNKKSSADSGLYGNGSAYRTVPAAGGSAYGAGSYPQRNPQADSYRASAQARPAYDAASYGTPRQNASAPVSGGAQPRIKQPTQDTRAYAQGGHSHRINHNPTAQPAGATKPASNGNGSGVKPGGSGNGANGGGNGGNGNGGNGNGKKPTKKKSFKARFTAGLKKFLRSVYLFGKSVSVWFGKTFQKFNKLEKHLRIFLAGSAGFVVISLIVIFAVSGSRHQREEAIQAELAIATPVPTIAPTSTLEPTPSPTPEIRIEKGAEGEDVMALQKRLMELNYLAIDEPTSYFGNATKEAVKLFQRQHELQQDGICGTETIDLLYSEEAKPYVMYEGAEGDDIQSFQEQLVELGYLDSDQVTSYYGTDTVDAVMNFQHRNYLTKDGKAGEKTLEAINSPDARVSYTKEQEIIKEKKKQAALARASSAEGRIDKLINAAKKQLGDPYILGKSGPDSFDCSGLVVYCLRQANVYTRRLNAAGLSKTTSWTKVSSLDNVQRGDLLFFKSEDGSTIGHVGIYIGGGEMIDASSANGKVVRRGAKTSYWRKTFVVARRPIE
ncbi:MAG TPA: peptidoglycan-binding protein [Clostridia bacterium]|nr:peptidoglycan-binding protein [Clostridia bacterium]